MQLLDLPAKGLSASLHDAGEIHAPGLARRHHGLHVQQAQYPPSILQDLRLRALRGREWPGRYADGRDQPRSEEHTSELQSLMRISYAVFCLKKQKYTKTTLDETSKSKA